MDSSNNISYMPTDLTSNFSLVDGWMFDPKDDTLLRVIVKVTDINDNSPHFVKKVFTGGVTTEADFGTEFMQVTVSFVFTANVNFKCLWKVNLILHPFSF